MSRGPTTTSRWARGWEFRGGTRGISPLPADYSGNPNIKFGGDIRFALNPLVGVNNNNLFSGQFEFPGSVTSGTGSQGLGYATFLLGDVNSFFRTVLQNTNA